MNDSTSSGNIPNLNPLTLTRAEYEKGTIPIQCSGWHRTQPRANFTPLEHDTEADVVVIGAGVAGASLTLHLAERGISVLTLEAKQPGNGASGRNAGHVKTYLENLEPIKTWPNQGRSFLEFFIQHRNIVFDLCNTHGIEGAAVKSGMVDAAYKKYATLEKQANQWKDLGYDVDLVGTKDLREMLGTDAYHYGVHWREGGWVNPYLFTKGMADAAVRLGAKIHGDSPAIGTQKMGQRWRVTTP